MHKGFFLHSPLTWFGLQVCCFIVFLSKDRFRTPEQISGNTALAGMKEYLTQESFHLRGSERQRYLPPRPSSGFKELKQLVPGQAANIVQRETWCFSTNI